MNNFIPVIWLIAFFTLLRLLMIRSEYRGTLSSVSMSIKVKWVDYDWKTISFILMLCSVMEQSKLHHGSKRKKVIFTILITLKSVIRIGTYSSVLWFTEEFCGFWPNSQYGWFFKIVSSPCFGLLLPPWQSSTELKELKKKNNLELLKLSYSREAYFCFTCQESTFTNCLLHECTAPHPGHLLCLL